MNHFYGTLGLYEMQDLAYSIAENLNITDVILLSGDLGTGKTAFAGFLINYFLPDTIVDSPTFPILNTYITKDFELWHFDLYRVKNLIEAYSAGILQAFEECVTIIEWPNIILDIVNTMHTIDIRFDYTCNTNTRLVRVVSR